MTERELIHRDKQELKGPESTRPGRAYLPDMDIYETDATIVLVADMPGVAPAGVRVNIQNHRLLIEGDISASDYDSLSPLYTEYNVGPFRREFELGESIEQGEIEAHLADGVLTVTLPKVTKARTRQIPISTG